jgi:hypothetical protein
MGEIDKHSKVWKEKVLEKRAISMEMLPLETYIDMKMRGEGYGIFWALAYLFYKTNSCF